MAYLVVVHNRRTIQDAIHLFRAIRAEGNIIMIHVDTKFDWNVYLDSDLYQEAENHSRGATVVVSAVHSADWSSWSMNDPTHWGMELATTRFRGEWDIFINLSGDCMPVYNPQVMSELFDPSSGPLRETNFVTSSCCETGLVPTSVMDFPKDWHKRTHYGEPIIEYVDDDGQDQQTTLIVHWGSQWMALQPDFVDYLVQSSVATNTKCEVPFRNWKFRSTAKVSRKNGTSILYLLNFDFLFFYFDIPSRGHFDSWRWPWIGKNRSFFGL
jgi:hypothetical protein